MDEHAESLRVKRLSPNAVLPVRGSAGAAGYDLSRRGTAQSKPAHALTLPAAARRTPLCRRAARRW